MKALNEDNEWLFDSNGPEVTLTTRQDTLGGSVGSFTRWVLAREVKHSGVNVRYGTTTEEITEDGVVVVQNGKAELLPADTVLLAAGLNPNRRVYDVIKKGGISAEVLLLGDSGALNHAIEAVREAYELALNI